MGNGVAGREGRAYRDPPVPGAGLLERGLVVDRHGGATRAAQQGGGEGGGGIGVTAVGVWTPEEEAAWVASS
jgi:hypothetical protein